MYKAALGLVNACLGLRELHRDYLNAAQDFAQRISEACGKAVNENEKIYFKKVPRIDELHAPDARDMTKLPNATFCPDGDVADPFAAFVPVRCLEASDRFVVRLSPSIRISYFNRSYVVLPGRSSQ